MVPQSVFEAKQKKKKLRIKANAGNIFRRKQYVQTVYTELKWTNNTAPITIQTNHTLEMRPIQKQLNIHIHGI